MHGCLGVFISESALVGNNNIPPPPPKKKGQEKRKNDFLVDLK